MGKRKLKDKEERLSEVLEVFRNLENFGLTDIIITIKEFKNILRQFVNDGQYREGKFNVENERYIQYFLPEISGKKIEVKLSKHV